MRADTKEMSWLLPLEKGKRQQQFQRRLKGREIKDSESWSSYSRWETK